MRILFVGQAPSRESDGQPPFTGKCGVFLAGLMGTTQEQMLADHDFRNLIGRWPGKGINGDRFPLEEARTGAMALRPDFVGRTVILLGANVCRALQVRNFRYLTCYEIRDPLNAGIVLTRRCYILPHPSGINRIWNRREAREQAREFFKNLLKET